MLSWRKVSALATLVAVTVFVQCSLAQGVAEEARQIIPMRGEPEQVRGAFTVVILPDTQLYAMRFPQTFSRQTQWIADNANAFAIKFVVHVGDVVQNNNEKEWQVARLAFAAIDGKVPYAIALGNHDLGPSGRSETRESGFKNAFPLEEWRKQPTFGGVYDAESDRPDNSFHRFIAGGKKWLVLCIEFGPRPDVLRWANEVVAQNPDHLVIVVTHAYLTPEGQRFNARTPGQKYSPKKYPINRTPPGVTDGEEMWKALIESNANMRLVISGHVGPTAWQASTGKNGNTVHEMVCDYQNEPEGGNGWLRVMQFLPDGETVRVTDYSPTLGQINTYKGATFEFKL